MTFLDFCSGIGGGRLGLESVGFRCLGFSEIDKEAIRTYKNFFDTTNELELGNLIKINPKNLPNFDILISGFPCQSFSIVGKREGFENQEKGQILFNLVEILKIKQPNYFILENVKGFVNHQKGETLKQAIKLLESCNYKVFYKVLNTIDFGLPHSRERVYFVGIHSKIDRKFDFIFNKKYSGIDKFLEPTEQNRFLEGTQAYNTFLKYLGNKYNQNKYNLSSLLEENFLILDTRQSDLRLYRNKTPTIRRDRQGLLYVYNKKLYKLSGLEALRLQGFYKLHDLKVKIGELKQSDLLRQCGNAMSVNVIEAIAIKIKEMYG